MAERGFAVEPIGERSCQIRERDHVELWVLTTEEQWRR